MFACLIQQELSSNVSDNIKSSTSAPASSSHSFDSEISKTKPQKLLQKSKSAKHLKSNGNKSTAFIGPTLPPEPNLEELALQKVNKESQGLFRAFVLNLNKHFCKYMYHRMIINFIIGKKFRGQSCHQFDFRNRQRVSSRLEFFITTQSRECQKIN